MAQEMEKLAVNPAELSIREATPADAEAIAAIYNHYVSGGGVTMDTVKKTAEDIKGQMERFNQREVILILEKPGGVIGWGIIKRYSDRVGYRVACETSCYLYSEERGQGYGPMLKKALIQRCRKFGYHHVVCKVFSTNSASIKYNQRLGFEIVGTQREIGFRDGQWHDMVIMQLILDDVPPYLPQLG